MKQEINSKKFYSLGIMSGTSMDGIDVSLILTDGYELFEVVHSVSCSYPVALKKDLQDLQKKIQKNIKFSENIDAIVKSLTNLNIEAIKPIFDFSKNNNIKIDLIGYHGQTIYHNPKNKISIQLGDPQYLSNFYETSVVFDFRIDDILNGGQGAPLVPIYHKVKFHSILAYPYVILNIGGISNITYINNSELIAFDSGPGNCLIDDLVSSYYNQSYDKNGKLAYLGNINYEIVNIFIKDVFFREGPPKSLDRNYFQKYIDLLTGDAVDKIATASFLTVKSIIDSLKYLPKEPLNIVICGGGSKNNFLVQKIVENSSSKVLLAEDLGFNSQFIEAEAFAFLAARRKINLPISFPNTTGAKNPTVGGKIYNPSSI